MGFMCFRAIACSARMAGRGVSARIAHARASGVLTRSARMAGCVASARTALNSSAWLSSTLALRQSFETLGHTILSYLILSYLI